MDRWESTILWNNKRYFTSKTFLIDLRKFHENSYYLLTLRNIIQTVFQPNFCNNIQICNELSINHLWTKPWKHKLFTLHNTQSRILSYTAQSKTFISGKHHWPTSQTTSQNASYAQVTSPATICENINSETINKDQWTSKNFEPQRTTEKIFAHYRFDIGNWNKSAELILP